MTDRPPNDPLGMLQALVSAWNQGIDAVTGPADGEKTPQLTRIEASLTRIETLLLTLDARLAEAALREEAKAARRRARKAER